MLVIRSALLLLVVFSVLTAFTTPLAGHASASPTENQSLGTSQNLSRMATPFAVSKPSPELLARLCQLITADSQFEYSALFDENFRKLVTYEQLVTILHAIANKNGPCLQSSDLGEFAKFTDESHFAFRLANEKLSIFRLRESATEPGKFAGLVSQGETLPPERMAAFEIMMPTRDGTKLRTFLFLPRARLLASERFPIVLTRTPYFNAHGQFIFGGHFASGSYYVERGYGFVYQSIRGVHGSEGEPLLFNPIEIQDGADAVRWIRAHAFSNGRIAAVGTSYEGLTAAAAGVENPQGLELIITGAGPTDSATGTFRNGWFNLSLLDYSHYVTRGEGIPFTPDLPNKIATLLPNAFDLRSYDEAIFGVVIPEWRRWAEAYADSRSPFWKERSFIRRLPEIKVPTYHVAGLRYDGNMPDTLNNFLEINHRSASRSQHRLILGYWDHGNNTPSGDGSNLSPFMKKRFDSILAHHLEGIPSPYVNESRIQVQSHLSASEDDGFIASDIFPLPSPRLALRFATEGTEKVLAQTGKSTSPNSSYVMDPQQYPVDSAAQSLIFRHAPEDDLLINGSIDFELYFAPLEVAQTDLVIQIFKEDATGAQKFLTMCAPGARLENRSPLPYIRFVSRYCHVFGQVKKGEKLGIALASNLFPTMARNTGRRPEDFYSGTPLKTTITLLHSDDRPSRLWVGLEQKSSAQMKAQISTTVPAHFTGIPQSANVLPFSLKKKGY